MIVPATVFIISRQLDDDLFVGASGRAVPSSGKGSQSRKGGVHGQERVVDNDNGKSLGKSGASSFGKGGSDSSRGGTVHNVEGFGKGGSSGRGGYSTSSYGLIPSHTLQHSNINSSILLLSDPSKSDLADNFDTNGDPSPAVAYPSDPVFVVNTSPTQNQSANMAEAPHQGTSTHLNPLATGINMSASTQNINSGQMLNTTQTLLLEGPPTHQTPTSTRSESSEGPWEEDHPGFAKYHREGGSQNSNTRPGLVQETATVLALLASNQGALEEQGGQNLPTYQHPPLQTKTDPLS